MHLVYDDIEDIIKFVLDTALKEAKKEDRLTKQIFITMCSAYSNNPINLLINAPSGVGKNYVINKVASLFPDYDILSLAGMTDKALFHRSGKLVIKNEITGEYESIEDRINDVDEQIDEKEYEISKTNDKNLKQGLKSNNSEIVITLITEVVFKSEYIPEEIKYAKNKQKLIIPCVRNNLYFTKLSQLGLTKEQVIIFNDNEMDKLYSKINDSIASYKKNPQKVK
jgi:hypothetical protein